MRYIQCWQIFEDETLDMWARYGGGVAIFSRFDLLRSALDSMLDEVLVGLVRYGNAGPPRYNLIHFLFMKRKHFDKERELRTVLTCSDPVGGNNRHFGLNGFPNREPLDNENPLHEWVHDYKRRRIDLKALVTEVRLSPWATKEEIEEIHTWVKAKHFTCHVSLSDFDQSAHAHVGTISKCRSLSLKAGNRGGLVAINGHRTHQIRLL